jgi:outer membrane protein insertion porin family
MRKHFKLYERPDGSGRHTLTISGKAEYTGPNTPIYENVFYGGFSSLRGFAYRGVSPMALSTNPVVRDVAVGGQFGMLASAEYMFPITADDMLRAVVFCDTGTVEPTINNWRDNYRVAPGFGLRITVPAMGPAPIALDFAFPVAWNPGDVHEMFSFFVGFGR